MRSQALLMWGAADRWVEAAIGDRALRLGFSGIGDYARERLGIAPTTALGMAGSSSSPAGRGQEEIDRALRERIARGDFGR